MKYKVGDKVRVRKDLEVDGEYGTQIFVNSMREYCGKVMEIEEIWNGGYTLKEDGEKWAFTDEMLEPITDPLAEIKLELNGKPYSEILKELTEPLDLVKRHKAICEHLNKVYADKNHDYGNSFGDTFEKYGDISALVRISDKMNRIDQLVQTGEQKVKDEALKDSILDMANYLIMWAMELEESNGS